MVKVVLIVLTLFFTACQKNVVQSKPEWYLNIQNKNDDVLIGYGYGKNLEVAKAKANSDIAKRMRVEISSHMSIKQKDGAKSEVDSKILESSLAVLYDVKVLKQTVLNNNVFVALEYNTKPIIEQMVNATDPKQVTKMDKNNPYFYTQFSKELASVYGFVPNYSVKFVDGVYKVGFASKNFMLKDEDVKKFQFEKSDQDIKITMSKTIKSHEPYFVKIDIVHKGYLHLFEYQNNGKIMHLINNELKEPRTLIYPDPKSFNGIETRLSNVDIQESESYLALLCSQSTPIDFFDTITHKYNYNDKAYRFTELYPSINSCKFSSVIVKIVPR